MDKVAWMSGIRVEKGLISVIIPNYNGEAFLSECLGSLLEQSFKGVEIIVVDNASTDGSVELVRKKYPGARLVRLDANRGFSTAVNAGIAASRGEFVVGKGVGSLDGRPEDAFRARARHHQFAWAGLRHNWNKSRHRIRSQGWSAIRVAELGFRPLRRRGDVSPEHA